jgi:hypothetical protein
MRKQTARYGLFYLIILMVISYVFYGKNFNPSLLDYFIFLPKSFLISLLLLITMSFFPIIQERGEEILGHPLWLINICEEINKNTPTFYKIWIFIFLILNFFYKIFNCY